MLSLIFKNIIFINLRQMKGEYSQGEFEFKKSAQCVDIPSRFPSFSFCN